MQVAKYQIPTYPIRGLNGKLAPARVKCEDTTDPNKENEGFAYGYMRGKSSKVYYAYRTKSRNLNVNPYTTDEIQNRNKFKISVNQASAINRNKESSEYLQAFAEYNKTSQNKSFFNWLISKIMQTL